VGENKGGVGCLRVDGGCVIDVCEALAWAERAGAGS
jgi:hypothetical protein